MIKFRLTEECNSSSKNWDKIFLDLLISELQVESGVFLESNFACFGKVSEADEIVVVEISLVQVLGLEVITERLEPCGFLGEENVILREHDEECFVKLGESLFVLWLFVFFVVQVRKEDAIFHVIREV